MNTFVYQLWYTLKYNIMAVVQVTSREFRARQASVFELADKGERVIISRGRKRAYALVPVECDDLDITPEFTVKIERARQEYNEGRTLHLETAKTAQEWMEQL